MIQNKYNIVMILADQHHADLMGCAGHEQVLTPNLDEFAGESVRFASAYCPNPICTPSRVSILSGQYCHNHGIYGLSGPSPAGLSNLMRHCKSAGYRTGAFGKLHLPNSPRNWLADDVDRFEDTYETAEGEVGKSNYFDYLTQMGLREWEDSWHNPWNYGKSSISWDSMPSKMPYEHTQEVWSAREAMKFMDESGTQPFCIQISFHKPHHPMLPVERFWNMYSDELALPPTFDEEPTGRPPHFREMWESMRQMKWEYAKEGESYKDGARRAWRGTLACISQVDDVFGMVTNYLKERGLWDKTIVIYSSDHGAYHGIHGIVEKAPGICSEAVCRVPLLWHVPGITKPNTVVRQLAESVDIVPTLTSLCGLPPMDTVDGVDITPLLRGEDKEIHQVAVTEHTWSKSIRWGEWRFVHYQRDMFHEDVGELYHIVRDPNERCNLYHDPVYTDIVQEGRRLLLEWLIRTTRIVISHPSVQEDKDSRFYYPLAGDGKAPASVQLRNRIASEKSFNLNYI